MRSPYFYQGAAPQVTLRDATEESLWIQVAVAYIGGPAAGLAGPGGAAIWADAIVQDFQSRRLSQGGGGT